MSPELISMRMSRLIVLSCSGSALAPSLDSPLSNGTTCSLYSSVVPWPLNSGCGVGYVLSGMGVWGWPHDWTWHRRHGMVWRSWWVRPLSRSPRMCFKFVVGSGSWCLVVGYSGSLRLIELSSYSVVVTPGGSYGCPSRVTSTLTSLLMLCMSCLSGGGRDRVCCFWCSGESTSRSCWYSSLYHLSWSSLISSEVSPNCAAAEFGCTNKSGSCCGCTYSTGG